MQNYKGVISDHSLCASGRCCGGCGVFSFTCTAMKLNTKVVYSSPPRIIVVKWRGKLHYFSPFIFVAITSFRECCLLFLYFYILNMFSFYTDKLAFIYCIFCSFGNEDDAVSESLIVYVLSIYVCSCNFPAEHPDNIFRTCSKQFWCNFGDVSFNPTAFQYNFVCVQLSLCNMITHAPLP